MSRIEHYFENLLEHGKDVEGEPNKSQLSPEEYELGRYLDTLLPDIRR